MKVALAEGRYGNPAALAQFQERVEEQLMAVAECAPRRSRISCRWKGVPTCRSPSRQYVPGTQTGVGFAEFRPIGRGYLIRWGFPYVAGGSSTPATPRHAAGRAHQRGGGAGHLAGRGSLGQRIHVGPRMYRNSRMRRRGRSSAWSGRAGRRVGSNPPAILYVPMAQLGDGYAKVGTRLSPIWWCPRRGSAGIGMPAEAAIRRSTRSSRSRRPPDGGDRLRSLGPQRFNTALLGGLAVLALLLAGVGLYGVLSYPVGQHTPEIGVRMALGASRLSVVALFLRQALSMVAIGVAAGLAGASTLTGVLRTLVSGIGTNDPVGVRAGAGADVRGRGGCGVVAGAARRERRSGQRRCGPSPRSLN